MSDETGNVIKYGVKLDKYMACYFKIEYLSNDPLQLNLEFGNTNDN